jgi:hypothetical protein
MVRRWTRSKKFGDQVQDCSASSISNFTLGGTLGVLMGGNGFVELRRTMLAGWG